uniref:Uncharacterized protein LOC114331620 n=1 Tax=Diabrotica virgifera virgifera TaxID=50390 RepID=A0A6P7FQI6_DIAVI
MTEDGEQTPPTPGSSTSGNDVDVEKAENIKSLQAGEDNEPLEKAKEKPPRTYVVYTEYQPNYDINSKNYCNRTAYLLCFWILTFQYTLLGIFIMLSACYLLMRGDFKKC